MGGATDAERAELHQRLSQRDSPPADLREAILQIGGSHDASAIPLLVDIVNCVTLPDNVREEAVSGISRIGGSEAVQRLLDTLLNTDGSEILARMSAAAFMNPGRSRLCLDPRGRDRLLRRLAASPAANILAKYLLMALDHLPIRDGAEVIAELATSSETTFEVNQQAIAVLKLVTDRRLLESLAYWIEGRPRELTSMWLTLAWERSLPIPLPWLKSRISRCRSGTERDQLLRILFQVLAQSDAAVVNQESVFLHVLVSKALHRDRTDGELARALVTVIGKVSDKRVILFPEKTKALALQGLTQAASSTETVDKQQLLLAVALVRHFRDTIAARRLLPGLLEPIRAGRSYEDSNDYQIALEVGDCLAELAPDELLRLPPECPGVLWALRSRSLNEGWMVYSDCILNAEGLEMASLKSQELPLAFGGQTVELQTLLASLPTKARHALESYWLMVRPSGPCDSGDTYPSIYQVAKAICDEEREETEIGRILRNRYPSGFPEFLAWTKLLNRVEVKFAGVPEAKSLLQSLGLYRR
jgi:hypothetical protein